MEMSYCQADFLSEVYICSRLNDFWCTSPPLFSIIENKSSQQQQKIYNSPDEISHQIFCRRDDGRSLVWSRLSHIQLFFPQFCMCIFVFLWKLNWNIVFYSCEIQSQQQQTLFFGKRISFLSPFSCRLGGKEPVHNFVHCSLLVYVVNTFVGWWNSRIIPLQT